jgi:predicted AlkP superfamily phosphohydrolase/phosphomutase
MFGIDAGDLVFIQANLQRLPVFRRLFENGNLHRMQTTSGLLTGSVWPTFYTGTLPGEHGIYHHLQWDPVSMQTRRVNADWLYREPFWYELARQGIHVTVADVPMVFPSRLTAGIEVVNWGSHDQLGSFHCNSSDLARSIHRQFGAHPMGPEIPVTKSSEQIDRSRRDLIKGAGRKGELIQELMKSNHWDFFLAVFGETHRGGHILWPEDDTDSVIPENALLDVYQAIDTAFGGILEKIDLESTTVILFSLHGMQPNMSQEHFVAPTMQRINEVFFSDSHPGAGRPPAQRSIMRWLRNTVPAGLQHAIARSVSTGVRDWVVSHATSSGYDWPRTPGFALLADYNGYLRFNIKGREQQGCMDRKDPRLDRYAAFMEQSFRELQPAGAAESLVNGVVAAQSVFPGDRSHLLPDAIITWNDMAPATTVESPGLGRIVAQLETGRSGNHRHEGFALVSGNRQADATSAWPKDMHIAQLAPSLLRSYLQASS